MHTYAVFSARLYLFSTVTQTYYWLQVLKGVKLELLVTLVEGDLKAPFSITTTLTFRGGRYSFLWIAPFYP